MKLYKTRVRLNGDMDHEVWLQNVTAAQLLVLTEIHKNGNNFPLAEVVETGSVQRTDARERERLRREYAEYNLGKPEAMLREVLGAAGVPLPQAYAPPVPQNIDDEYDDTLVEPTEDEVIDTLEKSVEIIKPMRTKVPRGGLRPEDVPAFAE